MLFRLIVVLLVVVYTSKISSTVPVFYPEEEIDDSNENNESTTQIVNETSQNLFLIKSVVYEVGILTDALENDTSSNETHEQIEVAFFDPSHNGSIIDLSNIPIPLQTNVSGVAVTSLLSANFGNLNVLENGTVTVNGSDFPVIPQKEFRVTHNISTADKSKSDLILSGLSDFLGLEKLLGVGKTASVVSEEEKHAEVKL